MFRPELYHSGYSISDLFSEISISQTLQLLFNIRNNVSKFQHSTSTKLQGSKRSTFSFNLRLRFHPDPQTIKLMIVGANAEDFNTLNTASCIELENIK